MSAILVTGGCGFIGSHLIDALLSQRKQVVCIDNLNNFYHPEIKLLNQKRHLDYKRYSFHKGDIRDKAFIREIFTTYTFDMVVHLAAMAGVRPSLEDPVLYTDVNINGTQVLLEEMKNKENEGHSLKNEKIKAAGGWDSFKIKPKANFSQFPKMGAEGAHFWPKWVPK